VEPDLRRADPGARRQVVEVEGGEDMIWEILIGAAVMTLVTVLFTGPGMWSSTWGWKNNKQKGKEPSKPDV
jgi:hypothetical protein